MKRIRVAQGKHVTISAELAEKAARVWGSGLARDLVRGLATLEPKSTSLMAGGAKPLSLSKPPPSKGKKASGGS
jgi:hypothetical protein